MIVVSKNFTISIGTRLNSSDCTVVLCVEVLSSQGVQSAPAKTQGRLGALMWKTLTAYRKQLEKHACDCNKLPDDVWSGPQLPLASPCRLWVILLLNQFQFFHCLKKCLEAQHHNLSASLQKNKKLYVYLEWANCFFLLRRLILFLILAFLSLPLHSPHSWILITSIVPCCPSWVVS